MEPDALGQKNGPALMQELRVSSGELMQLGLEYMKNGGRPTRLSEDINSRVAHALKPVVPKAGGGGRTLGVGYWCKDIETQFSSLRAIEAGNFGMADQIKSETACPKVVAGVTTGPELDRRHYTFSGGKTRAEFVKVRLNDGRQLWISMDEIEFR